MIRISSMLAAGAFACAAMTAPLSFASANDAATTEFSAQERQRQKATTTTRTISKPSGATARSTTTTRGGATVRTRTSTKPSGATTTTRSVNRNRGADVNVKRVERPSGATATSRTVTRPGGATTRTKTSVSPSGVQRSSTVVTRPAPRQVTFTGERRQFAGARARAWNAGSGQWAYGGRNYTYWRGGPYRVRYDNGWRTFVALSVLAPIAVGAATYYPYAYLSAPADVCEGITEDGCQLTWTEVETVEGGTAPQCVSYCPWQ